MAGFIEIINDDRLQSVPKILETPKGKHLREDRRQMRTLTGMIRRHDVEG